MKSALKIVFIIFTLVLVSCEKAVIVPNDQNTITGSKRGIHGLSIDPSNGEGTDSDITDPNDRNLKISNGVDVSNRTNIIDPTDSGNTNGKKPKK
jgi:hypothetical protein